MFKHTKFIRTEITDVLKDVLSANSMLPNGFETYPQGEYILQAVFLKMTGFQEQKMKCIVWDIATNDYEYRYLRYTQTKLGECSKYDEKSTIYMDLIKQIKKYDAAFDVTKLNKAHIGSSTKDFISRAFSTSNFSAWDQRNYLEFDKDKTLLKADQFCDHTALLQTELQKRYEQLYRHRNRCAHNTMSYQENLPTLTTLANEEYKFDNYFVRFAILIVIDKIFIELYNRYLYVLEDSVVF